MADETKQFKKQKAPWKYLRSKTRNEARRKERQAQHEERMKLRAKLSPKEQLQRLDWRLGKDQGAKKERERLNKQIEATSVK